ncbi:MAG: glycoside hydrolase family 3 N-terminal domain-containing protein [Thermoleophilaceae bacterium]
MRRPNYRRRRLVALVLLGGTIVVVALVIGLVRGSKGSSTPLPQASASGATGPVEQRSFLERVVPPPAEHTSGPPVPRSIADLAKRLPLERKVAELFLLGFSGKGSGAPIFGQLAQLDIGGLVFQSGNYSNPQQLSQLTGLAARVARRHGHVPPWLLTIQDGGQFDQLSGLPPTDSPSAVPTVAQASAEATQAARTLRNLGINGVLGPDVDVDTDPGGPYTNVSFSNDPDQVARFAAATVRAYLGAKMLTTPKHFPGLGAASQPTDDGAAEVGLSLQVLAGRDLVPFKAALDAGSAGVMVGHGLYTTDAFATPASESSALMVDLLRDNLGFKGIAVTDDLEAGAITDGQSVPDAAVAALKAGADMVFISGPRSDQTAAYAAVLSAARSGEIPRARLQQALLRILLVKRQLGLIA